MSIDVEEILSRELREVADDLWVPPMPPLPQTTRASRHWQPLLVAAAVVIIVAGTVLAVASSRDDQELQPTGDSSSPTAPTDPVVSISTAAPTRPYVLDQKLYVDGAQVAGTWWSVDSGPAGWVALRTDYTWWWGWGAEPHRIEGVQDDVPVLSPGGSYVGMIRYASGELTGFDTDPAGEGLGGVPIDVGSREDGSYVTVRAVTDDGWVIAQGTETAVLWLPLAGGETVDLTETAPGQDILSNTPAGLVVTDGVDGEPYLAEISDAGELTRIGSLPEHDDVAVSPGAEWLVWTPLGTTQGEVITHPTLKGQALDGAGQVTLRAPDGWEFRTRQWGWEDADFLLALVSDGGSERMARCSVELGRCELIESR